MARSHMISLAWPYIFLLLPLPWLLGRYVKRTEANQQSLYIPILQRYQQEQAAHKHPSLNSKFVLFTLAWLLLLLSIAQPKYVGEAIVIPQQGRDIVLAVDLSASMAQQDFDFQGRAINRLQAVKLIASHFIERRKNDRIALIVFGREAYLYAPYSHDLQAIKQLLLETEIGIAGKETAIGDAIGLALKKIDPQQAHKVMILMTDGSNTAGKVTPTEASELAARQGLKIYTVGIGADRNDGFFGNMFSLGGGAEIDEQSLLAIARATSGQYHRARDLDELADIYEKLNELEPVSDDSLTVRPEQNYFYLAALGFLFVLCFYRWKY